jgi:OOP family OmpA-OmpF porin
LCTDTDGDGVSDCFDRCPDTEAGVAVDTHGCCLDTDGDGVCDYKDKQLITPTECQPSDSDGIGNCPDPECCKGTTPPPPGCGSINGGVLNFSNNQTTLNSAAMSKLSQLASAMRANPNCKVVVVGNGNENKFEQQRSWDRVNSIINYMVEKQGIDRERFIFQYGNAGSAGSVEYRSATESESGPSNLPPPHPHLRK